MMWRSQNFLLYNGTIIKIKVNERVNNLKKECYIIIQLYRRKFCDDHIIQVRKIIKVNKNFDTQCFLQ